MNEKLFVICHGCDGAGEVGSERMGQGYIRTQDVGTCLVCDGAGFLESGLHTEQVEAYRRELRDCYQMIDECVSLTDVMRNGLSEDLLNRARLEEKYNHSFQDISDDSEVNNG